MLGRGGFQRHFSVPHFIDFQDLDFRLAQNSYSSVGLDVNFFFQ